MSLLNILTLIVVSLIGLGFVIVMGFRLMVARGSRGIEVTDPNSFIRPMPANAASGEKDRYLGLEKVRNARDLGGYLTQDGRRVRWGQVFRTGALGSATDADLETLAENGVRLICDLRSDREVTELPDLVPSKATHQRFPIHEDDPMREIFPKIMFNRAELANMLGEGYIRMGNDRAERFGAILAQFADPSNLPILFHCTAGKDRAGITAALLLALLGVPKETIIADYSLSNHAYDGLYEDFMKSSATGLSRFGVPLDDLKGLLAANPSWMEGLLNDIEETHGSIDAYLIDAAGLTQEKIDAIRKNLLEDAV